MGAAVTGAILTSYLGNGGTIVGTAVGAGVSTTGFAIYKHYLVRTKEKVAPVIVEHARHWSPGTGTQASRGGTPTAPGPADRTATSPYRAANGGHGTAPGYGATASRYASADQTQPWQPGDQHPRGQGDAPTRDLGRSDRERADTQTGWYGTVRMGSSGHEGNGGPGTSRDLAAGGAGNGRDGNDRDGGGPGKHGQARGGGIGAVLRDRPRWFVIAVSSAAVFLVGAARDHADRVRHRKADRRERVGPQRVRYARWAASPEVSSSNSRSNGDPDRSAPRPPSTPPPAVSARPAPQPTSSASPAPSPSSVPSVEHGPVAERPRVGRAHRAGRARAAPGQQAPARRPRRRPRAAGPARRRRHSTRPRSRPRSRLCSGPVPNLSAWRRSVTGDSPAPCAGEGAGTSVPALPATSLGDTKVAEQAVLNARPARWTSASRTRCRRPTPCRRRRRRRTARRYRTETPAPALLPAVRAAGHNGPDGIVT